MEHNIQLANVAEILIEKLHEQVNGFHEKKLIVSDVNAKDKVESGISSVYYLEI